ncbi:type II toxin-antitoxin system HicB family antitoxin [Alicyclobacillus sendaiensis]|uniref:type II toxin-antitoxin system HicB family antitoxin n=1 Tax=Alicyclobacillus sendaiensis TaxID=192387 RepID=UPI0026F42586|nr:type II toxin-antitoxin system HicB family antitoxin [Alicyclobacillus sendaiensis]
MRTCAYPAIFEPYEDGSYVVYFPDLPGCVTQGDDLPDAMRMAQEALSLHLYGMDRDGDPLPPPSALTEIDIPDDLHPESSVRLVFPAQLDGLTTF